MEAMGVSPFGAKNSSRAAALGRRRRRRGSIVLEASQHDNTLLRYRYNREFRADRGRHGEGSNCTGHSGADWF